MNVCSKALRDINTYNFRSNFFTAGVRHNVPLTQSAVIFAEDGHTELAPFDNVDSSGSYGIFPIERGEVGAGGKGGGEKGERKRTANWVEFKLVGDPVQADR